eukprot:TRINITY_DN16868_c0_g1_i1.p1 TRINITY_DN16868_c0_g1~~TRINITY_DN16868_c0_g1_i1.p1  ORF type:complete len:302 (+),score=23.62 TRINITY_DN16868_c0_g1_i1:67-972(+)
MATRSFLFNLYTAVLIAALFGAAVNEERVKYAGGVSEAADACGYGISFIAFSVGGDGIGKGGVVVTMLTLTSALCLGLPAPAMFIHTIMSVIDNSLMTLCRPCSKGARFVILGTVIFLFGLLFLNRNSDQYVTTFHFKICCQLLVLLCGIEAIILRLDYSAGRVERHLHVTSKRVLEKYWKASWCYATPITVFCIIFWSVLEELIEGGNSKSWVGWLLLLFLLSPLVATLSFSGFNRDSHLGIQRDPSNITRQAPARTEYLRSSSIIPIHLLDSATASVASIPSRYQSDIEEVSSGESSDN